MRRYWFRFGVTLHDHPPIGVLLGCGVTARDRAVALAMVEDCVFGKGKLPPITDVIEDVDVSALDPGHVLPNMGDPSRPGIWFPLGYWPRR